MDENMSKVKVEKIEITIGDKTISLTHSELKELRDAIDKVFPEKIQWMPSAPVYIERPATPWPFKYWEVTCQADTNTLGLMPK
jgi:hypothetical protein